MAPICSWKRSHQKAFTIASDHSEEINSPSKRAKPDVSETLPANSKSTTFFRHVPLEPAGHQIRLLEIHPVDVDGDIFFSLQTFSVDQAPGYTAISYAWGSPIKTKWILLNGQYFWVGKNAWYALWQTTQALQSHRYIWLDDICIDQSNLEEKGHQVRMMGNIFENAAMVYACVGEHANGSELLFELLPKLHDHVQANPDDFTGPAWFLKERVRQWMCGFPGIKSKDFGQSLHYFTHRDYWYRMWIVQELWVARALVVLCGHHQLSIEAFKLVQSRGAHFAVSNSDSGYLGDIDQSGGMGPTLFGSRHFPSRATFTTTGHTDGHRCQLHCSHDTAGARLPDILSSIGTYRTWKCSNFRDRVYSLSKIARWPDSEPPEPDYDISAIELYKDVMQRNRAWLTLTVFPGKLIERARDLIVAFELLGTGGPLDTIIAHRLVKSPATMPREFSSSYDSSKQFRVQRCRACRLQVDSDGELFVNNFRYVDRYYPGLARMTERKLANLHHRISTTPEGQTLSAWSSGRVNNSARDGDFLVDVAGSEGHSNSIWLVVRKVARSGGRWRLVGYGVIPSADSIFPEIDEDPHSPQFHVLFDVEDLLVYSALVEEAERSDWGSSWDVEKLLRLSPTREAMSSHAEPTRYLGRG